MMRLSNYQAQPLQLRCHWGKPHGYSDLVRIVNVRRYLCYQQKELVFLMHGRIYPQGSALDCFFPTCAGCRLQGCCEMLHGHDD